MNELNSYYHHRLHRYDFIQLVDQCHSLCHQALEYCSNKDDKYVDKKHLDLLADCAELCRITSRLFRTRSQFLPEIGLMCAEICENCGHSCRAIDESDVLLNACQKACKKCALVCRTLF